MANLTGRSAVKVRSELILQKTKMAIARTALSRYKVIDTLVRSTRKPYPTLEEIREACYHKLQLVELPSEDTIQKDIAKMRMSEPDGVEAPIAYCRKNKGYHYTDASFTLNGVGLNEQDINNIKEAVELLQNIGGSRVSEGFNRALEKILTAYKEDFPESNTKRKIIQTEYVSGSRGFEHFDLFFTACKDKMPVSFVHYSYQKRCFKAVLVHPVLLKEFDNNWYLLGYSEHHKSLCTFGFDRIYEPVLLYKKYIESKQAEVDGYYQDIYGVYPFKNQKKQKVVFKTTHNIANYIEAYPIHSSQTQEKSDNSSQFTLHLIPSVELLRLFRSYGKELKIESPQWLVSELNK